MCCQNSSYNCIYGKEADRLNIVPLDIIDKAALDRMEREEWKKSKKKKQKGVDKKNRFVVYSSTLAANKTQQSTVIFENKGKGKKNKPKSNNLW